MDGWIVWTGPGQSLCLSALHSPPLDLWCRKSHLQPDEVGWQEGSREKRSPEYCWEQSSYKPLSSDLKLCFLIFLNILFMCSPSHQWRPILCRVERVCYGGGDHEKEEEDC